jgi:two-component system, response regulator
MIWSQKSADILLVEDDARDAELALEALQERNISRQIVHVVDGYEALDFIAYLGVMTGTREASLPKLVMLDLKLKATSGLEVLEQLKSEERTKQIPVVIFTASLGGIESVLSYRLGVNSYAIKPTDHKKYRQIVGEIGHYWVNVNQLPPH